MKKLGTIFFVFELLVVIFPCMAALRAVDGDSLENDARRIRLEGIDAPEFFQTCSRADGSKYECGQAALEYLRILMSSGDVKCQCLEKTDKYKRFLCECFVGEISLNRQMVQSGWAVCYKSELYCEEEKEAAREKRGIWQGKHMRPSLWRILERLNGK